MPIRNTHDRFGFLARLFHWLIFLLLIGSFSLAWSMGGPLSPEKLKLISWHKWVGVTVFLVVILRLGWRIANRTPETPPGTPGWQRVAAGISHFLLYLILIALPVTGWVMSSAFNLPVVYLGLIYLSGPFAGNEAVGEALEIVHEWLANVLLFLIAVHVLAALYHHLILKDDILRRMLPWPSRLKADRNRL